MSDFASHGRDAEERLARQLEEVGYRVLRPLPKPQDIWLTSMPAPQMVVRLAIDCETTGIEPTLHELIELSIVMIEIDAATGDLVHIMAPYSALEQPSLKLSN